jgi:hypothetical protein
LDASSSTCIYPPLLWQPPLSCLYKVNCDAVVNNKNERIRIRIVVLDFEGIVVVVRSTIKIFAVAPVVAEALAAFHAVELYNEMSFVDIILKKMTLYSL